MFFASNPSIITNIDTKRLVRVSKHQRSINDTIAPMLADLEAIQITLLSLDSRSDEILRRALAATHDKYARELQQKQSELALLEASVSTMVQ